MNRQGYAKKLPDKKKMKRILILALKIALGSSVAIYMADILGLEYATSSGIITLLTLITTKRGTVRLSISRLITFWVVFLVAWVSFIPLESQWIGYGVFIFLMVLICESCSWRATISVNAVIGTHFLMTRDFRMHSFYNEFMLVFIGITVAFILNLFHDTQGHKEEIQQNMNEAENRLQMLLGEVAAYLSNKEMQVNVCEDVRSLETMFEYHILMDLEEFLIAKKRFVLIHGNRLKEEV